MSDSNHGVKLSEKDKRPLFFISGEDFYFLAYSILLTLEFLGGSAKKVKDHRKLAYLIEFISDRRLIGILERNQNQHISNPVDREMLFSSFAQAELRKREVYKILFSLEHRGFLNLKRTDVAEIMEVVLVPTALPNEFFQASFFSKERSNAEALKKLVQKISTFSFDTLLRRFYMDRGVNVWAS